MTGKDKTTPTVLFTTISWGG